MYQLFQRRAEEISSVGIDFGASKSAIAMTTQPGVFSATPYETMVQIIKDGYNPNSPENMLLPKDYTIATVVRVRFDGGDPVFTLSPNDYLGQDQDAAPDDVLFVSQFKQYIGQGWPNTVDREHEVVAFFNEAHPWPIPAPHDFAIYLLDTLRDSLQFKRDKHPASPVRPPCVVTAPTPRHFHHETSHRSQQIYASRYARYRMTQHATWIAGFEQVAVLEEPLAAAHHLHKEIDETLEYYPYGNIMVVDCGAWTCNLAIFATIPGDQKQKQINLLFNGYEELGGNILDRRALEVMIEKEQASRPDLQIDADMRAIIFAEGPDHKAYQYGLNAARQQKEDWSSHVGAAGDEGLLDQWQPDPFSTFIPMTALPFKLTHNEWMMLAKDWGDEICRFIEKAFESRGNIHTYDISKVLLVGGASQTPGLEDAVSEWFENHPIRYSPDSSRFTRSFQRVQRVADPQWCVVKGAAQAANLLARGEDTLFANKTDITYVFYVCYQPENWDVFRLATERPLLIDRDETLPSLENLIEFRLAAKARQLRVLVKMSNDHPETILYAGRANAGDGVWDKECKYDETDNMVTVDSFFIYRVNGEPFHAGTYFTVSIKLDHVGLASIDVIDPSPQNVVIRSKYYDTTDPAERNRQRNKWGDQMRDLLGHSQ